MAALHGPQRIILRLKRPVQGIDLYQQVCFAQSLQSAFLGQGGGVGRESAQRLGEIRLPRLTGTEGDSFYSTYYNQFVMAGIAPAIHALDQLLPSADIPASLAEAERLRQSLLADGGRGDLCKTIIDRVEFRPNGLRMILSLVPLTPAAAPPNRLQGGDFTREFPLRIKRRSVEMRFATDAPDPRATNPDPVLLKEVKQARGCFGALVSGRIGSLAELASREGISWGNRILARASYRRAGSTS
jgi:hypothetical protein